MPIADYAGAPVPGTDTAGANTYAEVIAAPARRRQPFTHLLAYCGSGGGDALISLDAGTTDHIYLHAGTQIVLNGLEIRLAIHAKNDEAGKTFDNLHISAW